MMKKTDVREVLTRKSARRRLHQLQQMRIMQFTVLTVGVLLCLLLLLIAAGSIKDLPIPKIWAYVMIVALFIIITIVQSFELHSIIVDRKALKKDEFFIETSTLTVIEKTRYDEIYHFSNGKIFKNPRKINYVQTSIDRLETYVSYGDTFYLLMYNHQERVVEYIFSDKFYRLDLNESKK